MGRLKKCAYATLMGLGLHAAHEAMLPVYRRHEHAQEDEPNHNSATEEGATVVQAAAIASEKSKVMPPRPVIAQVADETSFINTIYQPLMLGGGYRRVIMG